MPKDWGTTGIAVRTKVVKDDVSSWKNFFEVAPKYSGRIVVVDSPGDVFVAPLKALGYSLNSVDPTELDKARDLLLGLAPHVLALDSDQYQDKLQTEEAVLGLTWTGGLDELMPGSEDRRHEVHHPVGRDAVLDGYLGHLQGSAPPDRRPRVPQLHRGSGDPGQGDRSRTPTPRRTTRRRSSSPQEILDDPTIFVPQAIFDSGVLESAKDVSTDKHRVEIWAEFKSKIGKK